MTYASFNLYFVTCKSVLEQIPSKCNPFIELLLLKNFSCCNADILLVFFTSNVNDLLKSSFCFDIFYTIRVHNYENVNLILIK